MNVRPYTPADLAQILALHNESKFDYTMPSMDTFFSQRIVESDGQIAAAAMMRLTAEAYYVCNPRWRVPAWRFEALKQVQKVCNDDAKALGVQEVLCFVPPQIKSKFGSRLKREGWEPCRRDWYCMFKGVQ